MLFIAAAVVVICWFYLVFMLPGPSDFTWTLFLHTYKIYMVQMNKFHAKVFLFLFVHIVLRFLIWFFHTILVKEDEKDDCVAD